MPCNCIVIVREVWDTRDLVGDVVENGSVKKLATRFEPEDMNALEMALRIKDDQGGTVTAIALGEPRDVDVLREGLYRGVDAVVRIDADPLALDSLAAARLAASAVRRQEGWNLLLGGVTVAAGETAPLVSLAAALLDVEQVTFVDSLVSLSDDAAVVRRGIEGGYEDVEVKLPAALSVGVALVEDDPRTPRSAKAMLKLKAKKVEIPVLASADLGGAGEVSAVRTGVQAVPEKTVDSRDVDPEDETALKAMLDELMKGDA